MGDYCNKDKFKLRSFLIALVFYLGLIACFFVYLVVDMPEDYQSPQENYFASSDYRIRGKVVTRKHLGGCTFLSKIDVDTVSLISTIDSEDMDCAPFRNLFTSKPYVGLYNKRLNFVYFLAHNCNWNEIDSQWTACKDSNWIECRGVERPLLPINITIDTNMRKVIYDTPDTAYEEDLCPDNIYTQFLEKYKKNVEYDNDESVRF